jgi:hypothetical protein
MPYDSATGSSGPAHQACEYGVPIVCADIADFRDMAADEDMAVRFFQRGNAADLADQLTGILQSHEEQRQMAEQNFSAAIQMTLPSVVRNYLRWFELNRAKKIVESSPLFRNERSFWQRCVTPRLGAFLPNWSFRPDLADGDASSNHLRQAERVSPSIELTNTAGWQRSETGD